MGRVWALGRRVAWPGQVEVAAAVGCCALGTGRWRVSAGLGQAVGGWQLVGGDGGGGTESVGGGERGQGRRRHERRRGPAAQRDVEHVSHRRPSTARGTPHTLHTDVLRL